MIIINESSNFETSVRSILYDQLRKQVPDELTIFIKFDSCSNVYTTQSNSHFFQSCSSYNPMAYFNFLKNEQIFLSMEEDACVILQDYSLITSSFSSNYNISMTRIRENPCEILLPCRDIHFNENAVIHSSIIKFCDFKRIPSSNEYIELIKQKQLHPNTVIIDKLQNHPMLYIDNVPHVVEYNPDMSYSFLNDECHLIFNEHNPNNNKLYKFKLNEISLFTSGAFYPQFSILNCTKIIAYTGKYSIQKGLDIQSVDGELL